jgi:ABC-2 type transport system permease protein
MLWYKAWRDTRWRFLIGLGLLICTGLVSVLIYNSVRGELGLVLIAGAKGPLADEINRVNQLSGTFRGYIWAQFISQNVSHLWIVFAVLLGAEAPLSQRRAAAFTLSLPVSRRRLCSVRMATDLAELGVLALIPMLLVVLLAPAVGQTYALSDALVHAMHMIAGGAVFYCLALLLSTVFDDRWRPIIIPLAVAFIIVLCKAFLPASAPFSPASVMDGDRYFQTGSPAWAGLLIWLGVSIGLLYRAMRSVELRDF